MLTPARVLLVEGNSDKHVIENLWWAHHGVPPFKVEVKEGVERLLETLEVTLKVGNIERLGVVVDADEDVDARWRTIREIAIAAGFGDVTQAPDRVGSVFVRGSGPVPVLGIWLMPDNSVPGRLEDFVSTMVPAGDWLWEHAGRVVAELPRDQVRFKTVHRTKAHVHTWLAWQEEPGIPMGRAVTRKFLESDGSGAQLFVAWLRRLMVDEPGGGDTG